MNEKRLSEIIGKGYNRFWQDTHRYRVVKGGKGSKKSATTALNLIYRMMRYPEANLLVVRGVMNTHRNSTLAQLRWAAERLGVGRLWACNLQPPEMTYLPTGQKILFRGLDDVLKLASVTVPAGFLCWVWVEEAFEIEREADFDKLDLTVPRGAVPPGLFKQTTLTFNPWSAKHWLKARFFDEPKANVSLYTVDYRCNEWLDETDREILEDMRIRSPRKYAVAGLGEWGTPEGLIYENWHEETFDPERVGWTEKEDARWKYRAFFGLDYGYANDPTAFVAVKVNPIDKVAYIFDEFSGVRMTNADIAGEIIRRGYGKERIRADSAEPKSNEELRRLGLRRVYASKKGPNTILSGISEIQEYALIIHPKCAQILGELGTYVWKTGGSHPAPVDRDNHLLDALRYAFDDVRYFRPVDPNLRTRLTADERYERENGFRPTEDLCGPWI